MLLIKITGEEADAVDSTSDLQWMRVLAMEIFSGYIFTCFLYRLTSSGVFEIGPTPRTMIKSFSGAALKPLVTEKPALLEVATQAGIAKDETTVSTVAGK